VSAVTELTDAQAQALEPLRLGLKPGLDTLLTLGIGRSDLVNAWVFTTQSTVSTLQSLATVPGSLPSAFAPNPLYLSDATASLSARTPAPSPTDVGAIYVGALNLPLGLSAPTPQKVPFLLVVPSASHGAGPFPVVLFGHGLGEDRTDVLLLAGALASGGLATLAIDQVRHGERSTCVGSRVFTGGASDDFACADPSGQRCEATTGRCVAQNPAVRSACDPLGNPPGDLLCDGVGQGRCIPDTGNPGSFVCEGGTFLIGPTGIPVISGWNYFDLTNLFATRDNLRQSVLDFTQLVRMVQATGPGTLNALLPAGQKLDNARIQYVGQSLGGIVGTLVTASSRDIQRAALNVPGGNLIGLLLSSPGFASQKAVFEAQLAAQGITPGTPAYDSAVSVAKWIIDPGDPVNAAFAVLTPTRGAFVQYISDDPVVVNNSTDDLVSAMNRHGALRCVLREFTPNQTDEPSGSRHSFLLNGFAGTPAQKSITNQAQWQVLTFLQTGAVP
jgi:hypothetical protein